MWNETNLFTGCVDVPMTLKGVNEAIQAGKRICNIPVDVIYTYWLIRAQIIATLAMMQHRRKKVPIIQIVTHGFAVPVAPVEISKGRCLGIG
jgi:2,3-bisphosphoglycerate-dependent phosphoglycerate mutase